MDPYAPYAMKLRSIGQALEMLHLESFELESDGSDCLVRGVFDPTSYGELPEGRQQGPLPGIWRRLRRQDHAQTGFSPVPWSSVVLELRYTPEEIERLEREGQARRRDPHGTPDADSLSQLLRAVGAYLDRKGVQLLGVSRKGQFVTIRYQTVPSNRHEEELTPSYLRDLWRSMYLRRGPRA
ncbi:MAG: hypothetical protein ACREP8_08960 [Candidatus Binatia bacterium]